VTNDAPPLVPEGVTQEVSERVHVIPDQRIEFVPNAGILVGDRAILVIETAMGPRNGERILSEARRLGGGRKLLLTTTHFHPEHAFGAQSFADVATYICNSAQAEEMAAKGAEYIEMFSGFGPGLAELLADVELVPPDIVYAGERADVDLGGVAVQLIAVGRAHTRGDQVVFLPERRILFAGDLVEDRFLPIFPDADASGGRWLAALDRLDALEPSIVVGGHGTVGGPELIAALRDYLVTVRDRVSALDAEGRTLPEIESELEAELSGRQAAWDNKMWIKSAVDSFHGELAN
jgi:glyoxylase-like metal-dependent hydrolase (beta-lactamase superfamily II)